MVCGESLRRLEDGFNRLEVQFRADARLAKDDPEGFAQMRGALIRQLIDRGPRKEQLTEIAEQSGSDMLLLSVGGSKSAARITRHQQDTSVRFIHDDTFEGAERFDAQLLC